MTYTGLGIRRDEMYKCFKKYKGFNFREFGDKIQSKLFIVLPLCQKIRQDAVTLEPFAVSRFCKADMAGRVHVSPRVVHTIFMPFKQMVVRPGRQAKQKYPEVTPSYPLEVLTGVQ